MKRTNGNVKIGRNKEKKTERKRRKGKVSHG